MLKVSEFVRLVVHRPHTAFTRPDVLSLTHIQAEYTIFKLVRLKDHPSNTDYDGFIGIYEHVSECRGCGCPPFDLRFQYIPDEVLEHLANHIQVCSALFPSKFASKLE